jgi:hypothetical protein
VTAQNNIQVDIPTPKYWQDFEVITHEVFKLEWSDPHAQRNGREGQAQNGVDVFGIDYRTTAKMFTGVQCKKRQTKSKGYVVPATSLSTNDIDNEINAAKAFKPALKHFVIATTLRRDNTLQTHVAHYNNANPSFIVSLWFWDDFEAVLWKNPVLMKVYYSKVTEYQASESTRVS